MERRAPLDRGFNDISEINNIKIPQITVDMAFGQIYCLSNSRITTHVDSLTYSDSRGEVVALRAKSRRIF
ncbi:hypothetical protein [Sphingobium sp.]|uniref:hypothetical protein n=1 Tax=Sphingobium sp. TaxID=1912891 RepID=UPI0028BD2A46|nr:hypothetical protein [Sphingobium sp.]